MARQRAGLGHRPSSRPRSPLVLGLLACFAVQQSCVAYRAPSIKLPTGDVRLSGGLARSREPSTSVLPERPTWWRKPEALQQASSSTQSSPSAPAPTLLTGKKSPAKASFGKNVARSLFSALALLAPAAPTLMPMPAMAADTLKIGACLLTNCQLELGRCLLDSKCLANIICLNTCNGKENEVGCQIGCGNLFENEVVGQFNACALTKRKCVPQKQDDGAYPVPPDSALVQKFDMKTFEGKWYIAAGLNPLFDTFDCQVHFFNLQPSGTLYAKLNWRILEPDGEFFERNTIQRFVQDLEKPGILYNHDNEYLHYQDDWYILDSVPDEYVVVYYRGQNDAWVGYGGAVVYTRQPSLAKQYIPRIKEACARAGVDWDKFILTDNSCKEQTENVYSLRVQFVERLFRSEEQNLAQALTTARSNAQNSVLEEEKEAQAALKELEKSIVRFQKGIGVEYETVVKTVENELSKDVTEVESAIDSNVWRLRNRGELDSLTNKVRSRPLVAPSSGGSTSNK